MQRCIELASKAIGCVSPNPMVGSVIVYQDKIVGEGYHEYYGKAHAEVNAINSVKDKNLLSESTLYVNLEPCTHFCKTPPCCNLIIEHKIPKVIIGCVDTFSAVSGKGIEKMENEGIFKKNTSGEGTITQFQALSTALAATVGNGNIGGVATAILIGGPGAILWMWVCAAVGMATKYAEAVLGVHHRVTRETGELASGPMYYITGGVPHLPTGKILATMFAFSGPVGHCSAPATWPSPTRSHAPSSRRRER